ncbi:LIC10280 family protein [Thalassovita mangrovi]|nr:hypothetical protein [Thalassovita mangrovi]
MMMFQRTRRVFLAALAACLVAGTALAQSIEGTYRAEGRNPDGSTYTGTVMVTDRDGAVQFNWRVGNSTYVGTGTRNGDVIWVDWGSQYPVVYVRMPSGELHGTWQNGTALERLIP